MSDDNETELTKLVTGSTLNTTESKLHSNSKSMMHNDLFVCTRAKWQKKKKKEKEKDLYDHNLHTFLVNCLHASLNIYMGTCATQQLFCCHQIECG